jgi:hypothetical protein
MLERDPSATVSADHSDAQSPVAGTAVIAADPRFAGGAVLPYRVTSLSPCVGSASDGSDMGAFPSAAALPAVTSMAPAGGSPQGGTRVTVRGAGFTPEALVLFDGVRAGNVKYLSPEALRVEAPAGRDGSAVLVEVVTQFGRAQASVPFTYGAMVLLRGDANASGAVDLSDVIFVLQYLYGDGPGPACRETADVNGDGEVNIADAIALLSYLFAGGAMAEPPDVSC